MGAPILTEPCDLAATEARRLIGRKQLSPVELVESCIGRIEAVDHAVNAVVSRDFERARAAAREAEAAVMRGEPLGTLHGLPVGVKDTENTAGLRTTYGSELFRDHVPEADDLAIAAIREAGGIVLGKTNVPEWAAGANTRNRVYGTTGNPFDPAFSAAGSSGGSAAALACGMVPLATGSDLGGSLRNPAAFCGVVGFRPSPGLVPSERRTLGWSPLSVLGPMGRTVDDARLLLGTMAWWDPRDPLSSSVARARVVDRSRDLSTLRAAFSPDLGFAPVEHGIVEVFRERTGLFRSAFAEAEDAAPDCEGADEIFAVLRAVGFLAAHLARVRETPDLVGPNVRANVEEGLRYTAEDVARAEVAQTELYRRWFAFFDRHDVLITPAITISPRPWTELFPHEINGRPTTSYFHWLALAYAVTLAGCPAVALPCGLDAAGMPFGLQIVGRPGQDAYVLAVAAALEALLAGDPRTARPVPDLARLRAAPPISLAPGFLALG
jgi:amidase